MPWHLENDNPNCSGWAVVQDSNGKVAGCHKTKADAQKQMAALYANVASLPADSTSSQMEADMTTPIRPPRDYLVRALRPGPELRSVEDGSPVMQGHFAVFDEWTEIDSMFEGHFMERLAPGSFARTIQDRGSQVKVTFNHGHDPELGDKVLGSISSLAEDEVGVRYEVPLYPSVPPLLVDGLRAGAYGSSFRFRVTREDFNKDAEASDLNPDGLPERTIKEVELYEFGPVTFPAYAAATAGLRSMTDEALMDLFSHGEGLRRLAEYVRASQEDEPEDDPTPAPTTSGSLTVPRHAEWMRLRAKARK